MNSKQIRVALSIFLLILAGLIVWFKVVPNGQVTYSKSYPAAFNLLGGKGFIGGFTPADRAEILPGQAAKISGDPVYFSIFTPRTFSTAKITITFQADLATTTPIIEAGILVDNILWRYKTEPLMNRLLDDDFKNWNGLRDGDILLYQKNKKYSSVSDFLKALKTNPDSICGSRDLKSCLALYNTDDLSSYFPALSVPKIIPEFKSIDIPLQGAHQFYFIKSENQEASFDFDFTDLNLNKDSDPVTLSIYSGANKVFTKTIADNFGGESSGVVRNFSDAFTASDLSSAAGVYKLEIKANDDIVIKKINQAPSALSIIGHVHPVATSEPFSLWTDGSVIQVSTNNPASEQNLKFGGTTFSLSEAYKQFEFSSDKPGIKEISLKRDDVIIAGDGTFSFAADDLFDPGYSQVNRDTALSSSTQYVLAKYQTPKSLDNGWQQTTVTLNTQEAYREKGKYSFMISVPGLSLTDKNSLKISQVKVEFSGRTVWDKLKEKIAAYAK